MAKDGKKAAKTARRARHLAKIDRVKDARVQKSSHGKFMSVKQLEDHRSSVSGTSRSKTWVRKQSNRKKSGSE